MLAAVLAVSYFFSLLTFLPAALALFLGRAARGVPSTRRTGTVAIGIAVAAMVAAPIVFITVN